jgi:ribosomal protein S18 acetylase RimI-like enzyme
LVPREGSIDLAPADIAFATREKSPCIIVLFGTEVDATTIAKFPTVIRSDDFSPSNLKATASLLLGGQIETQNRTVTGYTSQSTLESARIISAASNITVPRLWPVEEWNEVRDMPGIWNLWTDTFKAPFEINQEALLSVLRRPGYAKHYVVRQANELLGFCATYLSYVDKAGENLIASLAILIVHPAHRRQGIGLSLHSHSIKELRKTRGIIRLQLGSTFPRILYGPPTNMSNEEWLARRGWRLDRQDVPGKGHMVYDLVLDIAEWRSPILLSQSRTIFRSCKKEDMPQVLSIVETMGRMGWFDQVRIAGTFMTLNFLDKARSRHLPICFKG